MKILVAISLFCISLQASALELAGVKVDDSAKVGNATLRLNGAGIRTKFFFKVYVGALYLNEKTHDAGKVLDESGAKRVAMIMLRGLSSKRLLKAFNEGMDANNSPAELAALDARIRDFSDIFRTTDEVKEGDLITLDYLPGEGTRVSINGTEKGRVTGAKFFRALLRVWLGDHPVDGDLKEGMLGER
jgi:Chalcone isomerase-like